jgi:hypothetical protein
VIADEDVTQWDNWDDPNRLPPNGIPAISVGLAVEAQREEHEEKLCRFQPSAVSAILKRAMEQRPQPEIVLVSSDSEARF